MNGPDHSPDAWLAELLDEPPLADDGFSQTVGARIKRGKWWRCAVLAASGLTVAALLYFTLPDLSAQLKTSGFHLQVHHVLAGLMSAFFFALLWDDSHQYAIFNTQPPKG